MPHKGSQGFHIMAKPTGAACNLNCAYCFFLPKESLYPGSSFRMSDEVMESYIRQTIEAQRMPEITIAWQGGEPTLMGLDFFRRTVEVAKRYEKGGTTIQHTFQTNGILLDSAWCRFFRENHFLVGISLDGPQPMHDGYRRDKGGHGTFERVVRAVRLMQREHVEFNLLCTVHALNSLHPLTVYRFFRDELGARHLQLIPIVEPIDRPAGTLGDCVTDRSVRPEQYGQFLNEIFDEWVRRDVDNRKTDRFQFGTLIGITRNPHHQSITEMAEAGVPEAAMQSIAGHLSKKMLDHYSHVRLAAKRQAVEALGGGLIAPEPDAQQAKGKAN
jgi:serine-type anaerobic sulfatase-maturating enzyme